MADILLEIGTEEIPARFMKKLLADLEKGFADVFKTNSLHYKSLKVIGTERRLVLIVEGLDEKQPDLDLALKGPPVKVAYDSEGKLTQAGEGFLKKNGLSKKDVSKKDFNGTEYLFAKVFKKGETSKKILADTYLKVLTDIHLPIAMRWGDLETIFIRPVHWIVSLYNDQVLKFEFAGIQAGKHSQGHRFLGKEKVTISSIKEYESVLKKNYVLVDHEKRRELVKAEIAKIEKKLSFKAIEDENLVDEVTFLNEWPKALVCEIDEKYLSVPQECLIATMKKNQKYFPLLDAKGKLTKYFIVIANNATKKSEKNIIEGNVKVVTARLEDAKFFYEEDLKEKMDDWVEKLKKVTYQEKIGSIYEKVERIVKITGWLADKLELTEEEKKNALRAAYLCKADLNSRMVFEFPELQGVMGKYYAKAAGEDKDVAEAMLDHWKPRFAGEDISKISKVSAIVAIADKIDSITSCFSVGLIPSSSSDPHALRRAAQGVVNLLLEKDFNLELKELIDFSLNFLNSEVDNKKSVDIERFFTSRIKNVLQERKIDYDVINAVCAVHSDPIKAVKLGEILNSNKKKIVPIIESAVRTTNIINSFDRKSSGQFDENKAEDREKLLFSVNDGVSKDIKLNIDKKTYESLLVIIDKLTKPVTDLFDNVKIDDENQELKLNKLELLKRVESSYLQIADFGQLVYK